MSGLKALKLRIGSVKSTRKITKAMQMVAAAKLRKAQEKAQSARPYADALSSILVNLSRSSDDGLSDMKLFTGTGSDKRVLLVVMTADRGLCGGFNSNILKYARNRIKTLENSGKEISLYMVGRRSIEAFKRSFKSKIVGQRALSEVKTVDFNFAQAICSDILTNFDADKFDVCELIYSDFKSVISQIPKHNKIIPLHIDADTHHVTYDVEPSAEVVLSDILPKNIAVQIYAALLENSAGEQGARMSAMDNATRNAGDMINRLTLQYNRTRQANITKELIEIISGAEAI
jgi:F-type H+-transporting ATPase subunit gamma